MNAKYGQDQSAKLSELNRKILEIKKKIQLSEGQRKALFDESENEKKANAEEIAKLKKEISRMVIELHENTSTSAKFRIKNRKLESVIGPLNDKSCEEVQELLDLKIIEKKKKRDILRYKMKQSKKHLADLGAEYQKLLSKHDKKELDRKVEQPVKKAVCELQNKIHAVEVQTREAMHIRSRYANIKESLKEDSDKFESRIKMLEEDLDKQKVDMKKLQKILTEANRMRSIARANLLREEREVNRAVAAREKEAAEGRKLVEERETELERLERKLFRGGRMPARPQPPQGAEEAAVDEKAVTPPHPVEVVAQQFEVLKKATGGTSPEDVLQKFKSQRETQERLTFLRNKAESEKNKLESKLEALKIKLDSFKYAEVKGAERKPDGIEEIKTKNEYQQISKIYAVEEEKQEAMKTAKVVLQNLHVHNNPPARLEEDWPATPQRVNEDLEEIFQRGDNTKDREQVQYLDVNDDKWLPGLYTGLVRRTPLPQQESSPIPPPPPGSEDEEEVPSRGYLKRQAQLVIDAKSRRKNVKIQLPRRN